MTGSITDWLFGRGALKQAAGQKKKPAPAPPPDPEGMRKMREAAQKQADRDLPKAAPPPPPKVPPGHREVRHPEAHKKKLDYD